MKIKYKIILLVVIVSAIINFSFTTYTIMSEKNEEYQRLTEKINKTNQLVKSSLQSSLWQFNAREIEANLNTFFADENILEIGLADYSGLIKYHRKKSGIEPDKEEIISSVIKLEKDAQDLGEVTIRYVSSYSREKMTGFKNNMLQLTFYLIIINGLAIFILLRIITRPVQYLLKGLSLVNDGNLDYRIPQKTRDEFGELSTAFNAMSDNLQKITASRDELNQEIAVRKKTEEDLREALSNVKVLKGFLPICSSCRKVRDDHGYWKQVEQYVMENSETEFSHTLCVDCLKKLYPDMYKKIIDDPQDNSKEAAGKVI